MTAILDQPVESLLDYPRRKLWTRQELQRMESLGLIDLHYYELIDGVLIGKWENTGLTQAA